MSALLVLLCFGGRGNAAETAANTSAATSPEATHSPGVWQKHEYSFTFLGFTSTYSCDGVAHKLKLLLLASGARADAKSFPFACSRGFGRPDPFASARLTFYSLAPTEVSAAATPPTSAAPGEKPPTTVAAAGAPDATALQGTWRAVKLTPRSPHELQLGDCELIEQFRAQVLPLFTTRNIDFRTTCIPHQLSGASFYLAFEALTAAPVAAAHAKSAAAATAKSQGAT